MINKILLSFITLLLFATGTQAQISRGAISGTPPTVCSPTGNNLYVDTTVSPPDYIRCEANSNWQRISSGRINTQTGASYTLARTDKGKLVKLTNAGTKAITLPQATASGDFLSGWFTTVINVGAGDATITPTTSTLTPTSPLVLAQDEWATIFSDGTNYTAIKGTVTGAPSGAAGGDLAGSYPNPTVAKASNSFAWPGDISPAQITSDQNDYSPTGLANASSIRASTDAIRNITGLAGGADGRLIVWHNIGAFNTVFQDEDAGSTAANRFALNADVTIAPDQSAVLQYDSTSSRWRLMAGPATSGGGTPGGADGDIQYRVDASTFGGSPLKRTDADTLDQYNSTTNQNFSVYGQRTSGTDYTRIRIGWTGGAAQIFSEAQTQGAASMAFKVGSGTALTLSTTDLQPATTDVFVLGASSKYFSEIYNLTWITKAGGMLRFVGGNRLSGPATGVLLIQDDAGNTGSATIRFESRTPSTITSDQNNYNVVVPAYFVRLATDASRTITGLTFASRGADLSDGEVHIIVNVGANDIVFAHESASSTAVNRILSSTGANITISPNQAVEFIGDSATSRWRMFKRN